MTFESLKGKINDCQAASCRM